MKIVNNVDKLAAFEELTLPYASDLYRSAICLLEDVSQAEMAVQECLLEAWRSSDQFLSGTNCRTRLYRILFPIVSRQRKQSGPTAPSRSIGDDPVAAIRCLPEPMAQVVLLVDVHDFTQDEVQETLGLSAASLRSLLTQGRNILASALSKGSKTARGRESNAATRQRGDLEESRRLQAAQ